MYKFLVILLSSFETAIITNAAPPTEPPYQVYPLILFHTKGDQLQHPKEYKIGNGIFLSYKRYEFTAHDAKQELLFCPAADSEKIQLNIKAHQEKGQEGIVTVKGDDYYNVEVKEFFLYEIIKNFAKKMKLRKDLSKCVKEPEPFISEIFSDSEEIQENGKSNLKIIHCGPDDRGKLYRYGYEILLNKELLDKVKNNLEAGLTISQIHPDLSMIDYEIYRFCYDVENKEVIYTQHKLISPQLLLNPYLWEERKHHYDTSSNNFGFEELDFEEREKKYKKYLIKRVHKKTSSEESIESPPEPQSGKLPFETEQLVPVDDFALALWMKPTHHYLNMELMNEKLSKLWNKLLQTIQKHAHISELDLNVYTKTFNMVSKFSNDEEKRNFEIVLEEETPENILKPPQIWIKIVHLLTDRISRGVAIIVNNHMNTELNKHIYQYCEIDYCKTFGIEEFPDEYIYEFIRCCSVSEKIEKLFNLNPKLNIDGSEVVDGLLLIEKLINITDTTNDLKPMNIETENESEIKSEI